MCFLHPNFRVSIINARNDSPYYLFFAFMISPDLTESLVSIRQRRYADDFSLHPDEAALEKAYRPSQQLAVYGTLAPGQSNFHVVRSLGGSWEEAEVRGSRFTLEMGHDIGYPGFHWNPAQPYLSLHLLVSGELPEHWRRLDQFEGPDYCRILVPVKRNAHSFTIANLYECKHPPPETR